MAIQPLDPFKGIPVEISSLKKVIRTSLDDLETYMGVEWTQAYTFTGDQKHSILIVGRGSGGEDIRFIRRRRDSQSEAAHSYVSIDGKTIPFGRIKNILAGTAKVPKGLSIQTIGGSDKYLGVLESKPKGLKQQIRKSALIPELLSLSKSLPQVVWESPVSVPNSDKVSIRGKSDFGESVSLVIWGSPISIFTMSGSMDYGPQTTGLFVGRRKIASPERLNSLFSQGLLPRPDIPVGDIEDIVKEEQEFSRTQEELRQGVPRTRVDSGSVYYNKYLKGYEESGYLYHITPSQNLRSILSRGIDRGFTTEDTKWMGSLEHVTTNYFTSRGQSPSIIKIDLSKLDSSKIEIDDRGAKTYRGNIPPEALSELRVVDFEV